MNCGRIELGISLNNTCNFKCRMCNIWQHDRHQNRLDFKSSCDIIDSLADFDVKGVRLSGGDPFLVSWSVDLAAYIKRKGYHLIATTNGSMITENFAKRISETGIDNINLSLDARNPETHDSIRGAPGSYENIFKSIGHLSAYGKGLNIGINTVISNLNMHEIIPLTELVQKDNRIGHIYFMAIMQPFGTKAEREWFAKDEFCFLWPKDKGLTASVLNQLIKFKESDCKVNNSVAQLKTFLDYFKNPLNFVRKNKCNLGNEAAEVNQLGDVYLCYQHDSIGNIFDKDFTDIWSSGQAENARKKIRDCKQNCNLLINCYFEE